MAAQRRDTFLRMPYLRNAYPAIGLIAETFETTITWDAFPAFYDGVPAAAREAARRECGQATAMCRLAFAYPDGPVPCYTVIAQASRGEEVAQWDAIKRAASAALLDAGGTITHHHAIGRDHMPWYQRQRPEPFGRACGPPRQPSTRAACSTPASCCGRPGRNPATTVWSGRPERRMFPAVSGRKDR